MDEEADQRPCPPAQGTNVPEDQWAPAHPPRPHPTALGFSDKGGGEAVAKIYLALSRNLLMHYW